MTLFIRFLVVSLVALTMLVALPAPTNAQRSGIDYWCTLESPSVKAHFQKSPMVKPPPETPDNLRRWSGFWYGISLGCTSFQITVTSDGFLEINSCYNGTSRIRELCQPHGKRRPGESIEIGIDAIYEGKRHPNLVHAILRITESGLLHFRTISSNGGSNDNYLTRLPDTETYAAMN